MRRIGCQFLLRIGKRGKGAATSCARAVRGVTERFKVSRSSVGVGGRCLTTGCISPTAVPIVMKVVLVIMLTNVVAVCDICCMSVGREIQRFKGLGTVKTAGQRLERVMLERKVKITLFTVPVKLLVKAITIGIMLLRFMRRTGSSGMLVARTCGIMTGKRIRLCC